MPPPAVPAVPHALDSRPPRRAPAKKHCRMRRRAFGPLGWSLPAQGVAAAAPRCAGLEEEERPAAAGCLRRGPDAPARIGAPWPPRCCHAAGRNGDAAAAGAPGSSPARSRRTAPCAPRLAAGRKRTSRRRCGSPVARPTTDTRRMSGGGAARRADPASAGQAEGARPRDARARLQAYGVAAAPVRARSPRSPAGRSPPPRPAGFSARG